jgi:hypothetical protein
VSVKKVRAPGFIVITLTVFLAVCGLADATVVLGQSIAGVELGMTHSQVASLLGPGTREPGGSPQLDYRHDSYQVAFTAGHATSVETFGRGQRTALGFGVGTTFSVLRAHQPALHCQSHAMDGSRDCYVGSVKRGHRYTDFFFTGKRRVTAVIVGDGYL